jgi:hypothetical protein
MKTCATCRGTCRVDYLGAEAPCPTCSFEDEICGSGQLHDDESPVTFDELTKARLYQNELEQLFRVPVIVEVLAHHWP